MTTNQTETLTPKRWLTIAEFTQEFGISKTVQYHLRKAGKLPYTQINKNNGSILYDRVLIDQWLESNSVRGAK